MSNKKNNLNYYKLLLGLIAIIFFTGCAEIKREHTKRKPEVNILTDIPKEHFLEYIDYFNLEYPNINLIVTYMPSGEGLDKILKEGNKTDIDVWLGNSIEDTLILDKKDLLAGYKPKGFDKIPSGFKDEKNNDPHWTGVSAYTVGVAAKKDVEVLLSRNLVHGLIKEELKKEISITNPEKTGAGYLFISYIYYRYGSEKSKAIFKALKQNIKYTEYSSYIAGRHINEENAKIAITTDYDALFAQWDDYEVTAHWLEENPSYNIEAVALINKDSIKKESEIFLDWCFSDNAAALNKKYKNILINGEKSSIEGAFPIKLVPEDLYKRAGEKEKIIKLWKES